MNKQQAMNDDNDHNITCDLIVSIGLLVEVFRLTLNDVHLCHRHCIPNRKYRPWNYYYYYYQYGL